MIEKEYIILLGFDTIQGGIDYMVTSPHNFSFSVGGDTYDYEGNLLETPLESSVISEGGIYITNTENPQPGSLYINGGFLKYYKEEA